MFDLEEKKKRKDTKLESEGAEFLVLGNLLIEGISTYKTYTNFPGYDLIAINPKSKKIAKIQVKSRFQIDYGGQFPFENLDCDFVVHVALNREYFKKEKNIDIDPQLQVPIIYIFPKEIAEQHRKFSDKFAPKVELKKIENFGLYINNWKLIKDFLE